MIMMTKYFSYLPKMFVARDLPVQETFLMKVSVGDV